MAMNTVGKRRLAKDLMIAGAGIALGLAISGFAIADITRHHDQMAQATHPLQSTPGAESRPAAPSNAGESQGVRPADVPPQPARPEQEAQKSGAAPALPPAPAEKSGAPIQPKG
jgi:hypothetical protein